MNILFKEEIWRSIACNSVKCSETSRDERKRENKIGTVCNNNRHQNNNKNRKFHLCKHSMDKMENSNGLKTTSTLNHFEWVKCSRAHIQTEQYRSIAYKQKMRRYILTQFSSL